MPRATEPRAPSGAYLLHPVVLVALFTWAVNDHVLKAAWPGFVTGKLSDVASLIVFPLLALAAFELAWPLVRDQPVSPRTHRRALLVALLATGTVMATINCLEPAAYLYEWGLGAVQWPFRALAAALRGAALPEVTAVRLWMDPGDLLTLPALVVPYYLGRSHGKRGAGLAAAAFGAVSARGEAQPAQ